jgi:glycosyltransferase involved in cell wall biosynthesis
VNYGGWHAELVSRRGAGLTLPPGNPQEAAERILSALADPAAITAMGAAGRRLAEQEFDRDRLAGQLLAVLEGVVA